MQKIPFIASLFPLGLDFQLLLMSSTIDPPTLNFISLEAEVISADVRRFEGITFNLNQELLLDLLAQKSAHQDLPLTVDFIDDWRQFVLCQSDEQLQNTWSFLLCYEGQGIFKTLIARDGDILHQVCADILSHQVLYQQLYEVHCWLIQKLLARLPLRRPRGQWINPLAWGGAIAIITVIALFSHQHLLNNPLLFIPVLISLFLVQWGIQRLLKLWLPRRRIQLMQSLLWGKFAGNYQRRRKGLRSIQKL